MRASKAMQHRVMNTPNIEILWDSETEDILGANAVEGVVVKNNKTNELRTLNVTGFFVAIGHKPNTDIFKGQLDMDDLGYIDVTGMSSKTTIPGVFAVGDCADKTYRQAVTAAGSGCMGALDAERYLASSGKH
jgi:thioredoxin reductase (NADPH)